MRLLFFSCIVVVQLLLVLAKFLGWVPSWSAVLFFTFLLSGLYRLRGAFLSRWELTFKGVWGVFFLFSSLALLGQEYGLWVFWTVENSLIITALFFSLALCVNTFFLKSAISKVLVLVPGVFLFILTLIAFLALYRCLHQNYLVPLWQVNLFMLFLAILGGLAQTLFLRRKALSKFFRSL